MARLRSTGLDLAGDRRDDAVADLVEHEERVVEPVIEDLRPDDAGGARLGQLDRHDQAVALAPHRAADDVVDVQHPAGLFRTDAALVQREHRALRDDEQAAQLGEPGDHVVRQRIGRRRRGRPLAGDPSTNGITAIDARRVATATVHRPAAGAGVGRTATVAASLAAACALADRHASRIGALSRPSASNSRMVAARCSSPSRIRPRRASAFSRSSCTRRSNGASSSHLLQIGPSASSSGARSDEPLQQRRVTAAEPAPLRREPAVEDRAAVDLQPFEESRRATTPRDYASVRGRCVAMSRGPGRSRSHIDEAVGQIHLTVSASVTIRCRSGSSTSVLTNIP